MISRQADYFWKEHKNKNKEIREQKEREKERKKEQRKNNNQVLQLGAFIALTYRRSAVVPLFARTERVPNQQINTFRRQVLVSRTKEAACNRTTPP